MPEWMVCPFCGYKPVKCSNPQCGCKEWLPKEARFCPACGTSVDGEKPEQKPPKPTPRPQPSGDESKLLQLQQEYLRFNHRLPLPSEVPIRQRYTQFPITDILSPLHDNFILGWTTILEIAAKSYGFYCWKPEYVPFKGWCYCDYDGDGVVDKACTSEKIWMRTGVAEGICFPQNYDESLKWLEKNGFSVHDYNESLFLWEKHGELKASNSKTGITMTLKFYRQAWNKDNNLAGIEVTRTMSTLEDLLKKSK